MSQDSASSSLRSPRNANRPAATPMAMPLESLEILSLSSAFARATSSRTSSWTFSVTSWTASPRFDVWRLSGDNGFEDLGQQERGREGDPDLDLRLVGERQVGERVVGGDGTRAGAQLSGGDGTACRGDRRGVGVRTQARGGHGRGRDGGGAGRRLLGGFAGLRGGRLGLRAGPGRLLGGALLALLRLGLLALELPLALLGGLALLLRLGLRLLDTAHLRVRELGASLCGAGLTRGAVRLRVGLSRGGDGLGVLRGRLVACVTLPGGLGDLGRRIGGRRRGTGGGDGAH